ncbi:hypothetical protein V6N13_022130 [Hibiscus sabdariffa]
MDGWMDYDDDDGEKRKIHTSVESGGGICCTGRVCRGNQRRRTCSKQFEDPPLLAASNSAENEEKEGKEDMGEERKGQKKQR